MENGLLKCWSTCLPRCGCPCHYLKRHRNRVGPSKPIGITVSKYNLSSTQNTIPKSTTTGLNGQTNLYFEGDEVIFSCDINSDLTQPNSSNNTSININGDSFKSEYNLSESKLISRVFLQLSKDKTYHVIHIKNKSINSKIVQNRIEYKSKNGSSSGDEDEEYWFTKWSKRPKLKNNFTLKQQQQQQNIHQIKDIIIPLNSRARLSYEELRNIPNDKSTIITKSSSSSSPILITTTPSSSSSSIHQHQLTSTSSNDSIKSPSNDNQNHTTDTEWPSQDSFQDEIHGNKIEFSENVFTNYGFQLDSIDSEYDKNNKTENEIMESDTSSVINSESELKSNGFISSDTPHNDEEEDGNLEMKNNSNIKPLLFFIHGISGCSDIWKSQFEYFHNCGYEIVAPDILGHGMSSTPNKSKYYLFESLVEDLVTVFDHFVTENRITVIIGHGYGACMGTLLSRIRSKNIIILISVSGGGPTPLIPFGCLERPILPFRMNLFKKNKCIGRFDNPELEYILPQSIHENILNGQLWIEGDGAFHRRITVPTLLVYGMRDNVVSLVEECEMERTIPKAFLEIIPNAGHMVMWDQPKIFNKMLNKFIQSWN